MPYFSQSSITKLDTCDVLLMTLFNKIIENRDCTIISGYRTPEEQFELFKIGRKEVNGEWKKVGKTVTNCDGFKILSDHNHFPSKAVDVMPYPIDWKNIQRIKEFAAYVKGFAANMGIPVLWGGDWKSKDRPHWYIK